MGKRKDPPVNYQTDVHSAYKTEVPSPKWFQPQPAPKPSPSPNKRKSK